MRGGVFFWVSVNSKSKVNPIAICSSFLLWRRYDKPSPGPLFGFPSLLYTICQRAQGYSLRISRSIPSPSFVRVKVTTELATQTEHKKSQGLDIGYVQYSASTFLLSFSCQDTSIYPRKYSGKIAEYTSFKEDTGSFGCHGHLGPGLLVKLNDYIRA